MKRRIVGIETEYGVVVVPAGDDPLTSPPPVPEVVARMFARASARTNHFLGNGARLYVDIGSHPEYAGAECDRIKDVVAGDRAGDRIVAALAAEAAADLERDGMHARIHLLRNNTDSLGNTFGCHENYQVQRDIDFDTLADSLTAHLVTRPVLTGCGHLVREPGGARFAFSTRAEHMALTTSADPTKARPLINTKDEPHADGQRWRRLHVLCGDSSVAEPTTALKVGWTCLVLDLVEAGRAVDDLVPTSPMEAMRAYNGDLTGRRTMPTRGGRDLSAVDIQSELLARVHTHLERDGRPDDRWTPWVLDLVAEGLDAVREGAPERVETRLDWAVKHRLLTVYAGARGLDLGDPRVARLELAYHDLDADAGLAPRLRRAGQLDTLVSEADVAAACTTPPATTRASVRGRFVAWVEDRGLHASVDWSEVRLNRPVGRPIELADAFAPDNLEVEALMAAVDERR